MSQTQMPWSAWTDPDVGAPIPMSALFVTPERQVVDLLSQNRFNINSLQPLAEHVSFPTSFVERLTPTTQALVMNDVLGGINREVRLLTDGNQLIDVVPAGRAIISRRAMAETAFAAARVVNQGVEVTEAITRFEMARVTFMTPEAEARPVTSRRGDVLRIGVRIELCRGGHLEVSQLLVRLICTNGMTALKRGFSFRRPAETSPEHQAAWLSDMVNQALSQADGVVERARRMAGVSVGSNINEILYARLRALGVPRRLWGRIAVAWLEEEDPTEWGLLNALTRFATHDADLSETIRQRFQELGGSWVAEFDLVTAELPTAVARRIGARVLGPIETTVA
jgi:hypothetical protein